MGIVVKGDFVRKKGDKTTAADQPIQGYRLKLGVAFSDPLIWRILQVSGKMTLAELHLVFQACMGWNDLESHQFLVGKKFYQPGAPLDGEADHCEAGVQLFELEEGMQFLFTYLYGAGNWELEIAVEEVLAAGSVTDYAVLLDGKGCCPPEELGDIHAYQLLLSNLEKSGGRIPGYPDLNPDTCDIDGINNILKTMFND
ncbi:MAG: hypothetical protein CSA26_05015 [Desulfobacterales bacterium]|nr:MAG: hypothetical protein CSA26_05015 [Desulfobacterales bacterium]